MLTHPTYSKTLRRRILEPTGIGAAMQNGASVRWRWSYGQVPNSDGAFCPQAAPWLPPAATTDGRPSFQAVHRRAGTPQPHTAHRRPIYPGTAAKVSGNNQSQRSTIETSLA